MALLREAAAREPDPASERRETQRRPVAPSVALHWGDVAAGCEFGEKSADGAGVGAQVSRQLWDRTVTGGEQFEGPHCARRIAGSVAGGVPFALQMARSMRICAKAAV